MTFSEFEYMIQESIKRYEESETYLRDLAFDVKTHRFTVSDLNEHTIDSVYISYNKDSGATKLRIYAYVEFLEIVNLNLLYTYHTHCEIHVIGFRGTGITDKWFLSNFLSNMVSIEDKSLYGFTLTNEEHEIEFNRKFTVLDWSAKWLMLSKYNVFTSDYLSLNITGLEQAYYSCTKLICSLYYTVRKLCVEKIRIRLNIQSKSSYFLFTIIKGIESLNLIDGHINYIILDLVFEDTTLGKEYNKFLFSNTFEEEPVYDVLFKYFDEITIMGESYVKSERDKEFNTRV